MNEQITAGDHVGQVVSWGLLEGKKAPQVFVKMDIGLTWFGSLAEGRAREITLEALVTMGFQGDDLSDLLKYPENALDKNRDLRLVVEYEPDGNGEPKPRIRWVNDVNGGKFKNQLGEVDALKALSGLKVKGDLMKIRKDRGLDNEPKRQLNVPAGSEPTAEEIPF